MAQIHATPGAPGRGAPPAAWWVDVVVVGLVAAMIYAVVSLATRWASPMTASVEIDLSWRALPGYAALSTTRMAVAYLIAAAFSISYARIAAASRSAERVMIPLLDILQSVPILSFMPAVVLGLVALFPDRNLGLELAAVLLIFTSQAWNMAFSFHQSLATIPKDLHEAATMYHLNFWQRFSRLELPFGLIPFIWNSMMSWAGGWFFLMAAEQFTLGGKDFRLPGLGSYLATAANRGDVGALALGLGTLIALIVLLDQVLWRPLVAWSDRFKIEQTESAEGVTSWVLTTFRRSAMLGWVWDQLIAPLGTSLDRALTRVSPRREGPLGSVETSARSGSISLAEVARLAIWAGLAVAAAWGAFGALGLLATVTRAEWGDVAVSAVATLLRTTAALCIGAAWTIPVGVWIGMNPRLAQRAQPIVQVVASIPATAVFPALLLILLRLPGGLSVAAVALMLLGTQWYILFNVIAGAMAIPNDLREAASVYKLGGWRRWRHLILPAIFPFLLTGMITATGGAWNASIVAEYVTFGQQTFSITGLGALIAGAADAANFSLLLAGTLTMAAIVVVVNRLFWRRLYAVAEQRYRLD